MISTFLSSSYLDCPPEKVHIGPKSSLEQDMASKSRKRGHGWTLSKARRSDVIDYEALGIELTAISLAPQPVSRSPLVYDMDSKLEREKCIVQLWKPGGLAEAQGSLATCNEALAAMLRACTANGYRPADEEAYMKAREMRLEATLSDLVRDQNQKMVPIWTAALSVACAKHQLAGSLWSMIAGLRRGALLSSKSTQSFIEEAVALRPPPPEPLMEVVAFTVFDNYTRRCLYKSTVSAGEGGYRLDMTNYGRVRVPLRLLPAGFDGQDVFQNLYRNDISLRSFTNKFNWDSIAMVSRKQERFVKYLKAAAVGELFKRPTTVPSWVADIDWGVPPIWGRLQSKHDDVKFEMNMQRNKLCPDAMVNIQGGDGLAIARANQEIADDPDTFLDTSPAVVPMLGESPHGLHHIRHVVHRNFRPFIMRCAEECRNPAIVEDPAEVKHFNSHIFFDWVIIRACAEYIYEISRGPGGCDFEDTASFLRASEANVDLAWVVHYLYDGGFLELDFKQSVRANLSDELDKDWCEFVTLARTGSGHKTSYGILAIMQVYRSVCLHPKLAELWRTVRTLPMSSHAGARVGHDSPCEWLHADITASVRTRVTEASIENFIRTRPFCYAVDRQLRSVLDLERDTARLKIMDDDVKILKDMFRTKIGNTWVRAARANSSSQLMTAAAIGRSKAPWKEYDAIAQRLGKDSTAAYVRRHLQTYAFRHEWQR